MGLVDLIFSPDALYLLVTKPFGSASSLNKPFKPPFKSSVLQPQLPLLPLPLQDSPSDDDVEIIDEITHVVPPVPQESSQHIRACNHICACPAFIESRPYSLLS